MSYLTCEITENGKVVKLITKETTLGQGELLISVENFRHLVNETLTNMIEDNGEIDDYINDDEESSNDESIPVPVSPKKRKK